MKNTGQLNMNLEIRNAKTVKKAYVENLVPLGVAFGHGHLVTIVDQCQKWRLVDATL